MLNVLKSKVYYGKLGLPNGSHNRSCLVFQSSIIEINHLRALAMWTLKSHQTPLHSILSRRQTRRRRVKQHQHVVSFHNLSPFNLSIPLTIAYLHHTFSTWLVRPQVEWSNKRQEQKQLQHVQAEISRGTFPVPSPLVPPLDLVVEPKRALRAAELALMSFRRNTGMSLQQKVRGNMAKLDMAIMKGFLCLTYLWPNLNLAI